MIKTKDILDEKDKRLRAKNKDVVFPLSKEKIKLIDDMLEHLYYSQIEEYSEKYDLRPGMGLAAPQLGINENFFVICHEEYENEFKNYVIINPKMISHSEEMIYASEGEGCLSVPGKSGTVTRPNYVIAIAYDENMQLYEIEGTELLARAICHELDHLDGHLYVEKVEGDLVNVSDEDDYDEFDDFE